MNSVMNCSDVTYFTRMPGCEPVHVVADRDQQVGLAQAHAAVDEQRVVGGGRRRLGDGHRRGVGEPVAGPGTNASNV